LPTLHPAISAEVVNAKKESENLLCHAMFFPLIGGSSM
jgi:hypothetical protein